MESRFSFSGIAILVPPPSLGIPPDTSDLQNGKINTTIINVHPAVCSDEDNYRLDAIVPGVPFLDDMDGEVNYWAEGAYQCSGGDVPPSATVVGRGQDVRPLVTPCFLPWQSFMGV